MQEVLERQDFNKFHNLSHRLIENVDKMLSEDIAILMSKIPHEESTSTSEPTIKGGAFTTCEDNVSPFGYKRGEGVDAGNGDPIWIVQKDKAKFDEIFSNLSPIDGKITGATAKNEMIKSKLPNSVLGKFFYYNRKNLFNKCLF